MDGEGSITIVREKNGQVRWRLRVTNTAVPLMEWLAETFGGKVWLQHFKPETGQWNKLPLYHWGVFSHDALLWVFDGILPYMRIKRGRAQEAVDGIRAHGQRGAAKAAAIAQAVSAVRAGASRKAAALAAGIPLTTLDHHLYRA